MKTRNKAEIYNSPEIDEIFNDISDAELSRTRNRMLLAAKIDGAIKAIGWKKTDFAREMKKSPSEISKWLSGTHNFTVDTLSDIGEVLGIHLLNIGQKEEIHYSYSISVPVSIEQEKWPFTLANEGNSYYNQSVILSRSQVSTIN
jgi:transcriptional regulator with XRE-family HTH domain